MRWRGILIGTASLEFSERSNIDGKGTYQLSGIIRCLGFLRRYWLNLFEYRGEEKFSSKDSENSYFAFSSPPTQDMPDKSTVEVWIRNSRERTLYVRCRWLRGEVLISPHRKRFTLEKH
jgi:hypothetical protein